MPQNEQLAFFLLAACGASQPASENATPSSKPGSKAEECLKQAALPREPRKDAPERIAISQILVRYAELDRAEGATRTRGEACLRAEEARQKLLAGADWNAIVQSHSDAGGATNGSLGNAP